MSEVEKKINALPDYSVLMQVYNKVPPEQLEQAVRSMLGQSHAPVDFVLICDGELTEVQEDVISAIIKDYPEKMNIQRFSEHITVGAGSNHGMKHCKCELIARMDADDIAMPERCAVQVAEFAAHPELDIVGGYIAEFKEGEEQNALLREVPLEHEEIVKYARRRAPFNNVTVMMKKAAAQAAGGYRDLTRAEDYDLYCRMLMNGAKGRNLPQVMVRCRVSEDGYERRKGWEHAKSLISVRRDLYKMGFTGLLDFLIMSAIHIAVFLMPASFTNWLYSRHLRKGESAQNKTAE